MDFIHFSEFLQGTLIAEIVNLKFFEKASSEERNGLKERVAALEDLECKLGFSFQWKTNIYICIPIECVPPASVAATRCQYQGVGV